MRIAVIPPRGSVIPEGSPWVALIEGLRGSGHQVDGYGKGYGSADGLVVLNHQPEVERLQTINRIGADRTALIALEPKVTAPLMYRNTSLKMYGLRYAASPIWARQIDGGCFFWPQDLTPKSSQSHDGVFAATLINADKRSAVNGSLYGLRRSVIHFLDNNALPLAVFGQGWGDSYRDRLGKAGRALLKAGQAKIMPDTKEALSGINVRPKQWMGIAKSKSEAFAVAPMSIVIENSRDYVSEKLIDAVTAGVVPLYVGPPLGDFGLPSEIALTSEPSPERIYSLIRQSTDEHLAQVIAAGQQWLVSAEARKHDIRFVLTELGHRIGERLSHVR